MNTHDWAAVTGIFRREKRIGEPRRFRGDGKANLPVLGL
jgi:hypothetical protein